MASKNAKEGAVGAGIAGALAVGMVCPPAGVAIAVGTAILGHIFGVGRFAGDPSPKAPTHPASVRDLVPEEYEHLARGVQLGVHDATVEQAYRIAVERARLHEGAQFQLSDLGHSVRWAVRSRTGKLIEYGDVEIPLQD